MSIIASIKAALQKHHQNRTFNKIEAIHRANGATNPHLEAHREIFIRGEYLERYQDFASDRYLKGYSLASSAKEFIDTYLSNKTSVFDTATTAKIRAIIREMRPEEALHPDALAKRNAEDQALIDAAYARVRELYGTEMRSPAITRVLNGRA